MLMNLLAKGNPLEHVVDHPWIRVAHDQFTLVSNHIIIMAVAAVLVMVLIPLALRMPERPTRSSCSRRAASGTPSKPSASSFAISWPGPTWGPIPTRSCPTSGRRSSSS